MVYDTKRWIRESVMQGEGISTPHIHRTRWDPFNSCVCSSANANCYLINDDREKRRKRVLFLYYFEFAAVSKPCAYVFPRAMGKSKLRSSSKKCFKLVVLILRKKIVH